MSLKQKQQQLIYLLQLSDSLDKADSILDDGVLELDQINTDQAKIEEIRSSLLQEK